MARKRRPRTNAQLEAPTGLPAGARAIWDQIVGAKAADHFDLADTEHLRAYVYAAWRLQLEIKKDQRKAGTADSKVIQDATSIMARFGPQLRITVSSRMEPRTAGSSNTRKQTEAQTDAPSNDWRARVGKAQKTLH